MDSLIPQQSCKAEVIILTWRKITCLNSSNWSLEKAGLNVTYDHNALFFQSILLSPLASILFLLLTTLQLRRKKKQEKLNDFFKAANKCQMCGTDNEMHPRNSEEK